MLTQLKRAVQNGEMLDASDVNMAMNTVERALNTSYVLTEESTAKSLVGVLSNLLDSSDDVLALGESQSNVSTRSESLWR